MRPVKIPRKLYLCIVIALGLIGLFVARLPLLMATNGGIADNLVAYPNPTAGPVHLNFISTINGTATLTIYTIMAKPVRTFSLAVTPGVNDFYWDGTTDGLTIVASGVYFWVVKVSVAGGGFGENYSKLTVIR